MGHGKSGLWYFILVDKHRIEEYTLEIGTWHNDVRDLGYKEQHYTITYSLDEMVKTNQNNMYEHIHNILKS